MRDGLVSSFEGEIREILFTVPEYGGRGPVATVLKTLVAELPDECKAVVIAAPKAKKQLQSIFGEKLDRDKSIEAPEYIDFTVWAEDPYCVFSKQNQTIFIDPYRFDRNADAILSSMIASKGNFRTRRIPLMLQGGNILVGDTFVLIGVDEGADSMGTAQWIPDGGAHALQARIRKAYQRFLDPNKDIIFIGTKKRVPAERITPATVKNPVKETKYACNHRHTAQPVVHIDMFVTLVGRNDEGRFVVLVGCPRKAARQMNCKLPIEAMAPLFDDIAEQMTAMGFVVERNPLPLVAWSKSHPKDPRKNIDFPYEERWSSFATQNNCLVQNSPGKKRVWLPVYRNRKDRYRLKYTEEFNKELWGRLGFRVSEIPGCSILARNIGSIHCIKKYLNRR